jgi:ferritin-like metal-binding protein YciE
MNLQEVLIEELKDLYSAENQLVKSLPKAAKGTSSHELKQAFLNHLEETKGHVVRLQHAFEMLGKKPVAKHCKGMEGAIAEVQEALSEDAEGALLDAGIIGAAARIEHYEIAGYTTSIAVARTLGQTEVATLLTQTLTEEQNAGKLVMTLAKGILKEAATQE